MMSEIKQGAITRVTARRPLTIFAACYAVGCGCQAAVSGAPVLSGIMLAATVVLFFLFKRRAYLFAAAVFLGALCTGAAMGLPEPVMYKNPRVEARVLSVRGEGDVYERFVMDRVYIDGERYPYKVDAYAYGGVKIMPGDTIRFTGTLYSPANARNPGGSDEVMMLWKDGIALRASVSAQSVEVVSTSTYMSFFPKMRGLLSQRISALFEKSPELAKALCLGVRDALPQELKADFRDMGISHLLAISGFNVECIALLLDFLLSRFRVSKRTSSMIVIMFFGFFVMLVGFSPSLLRAALMYVMLRVTPLMGRPADGMTRLSVAFLALALFKPLSVFDYGFVLSFSAVAGLMLFMPMADGFLKTWAQQKGKKRPLLRRAVAFVLSMACVSAIAQLATLPAVATYYGAISPWSIIANLIAVPVITVGLPISLLAIGASYIHFSLGAFIAWVPDNLYMLLTRIMAAMTSLPFSKAALPGWPWYLTFLYAAAVVLMSRFAKDFPRIRRGAALSVPVLIALSFLLRTLMIPGGLTLTFLDAGSADATAVFAERSVYLMDAGDTDTPAADYLAHLGIGRVEGVFLSHPHKDHAGGLLRVLNQAEVKTLYLPEHWDEVECDHRVQSAVETARERGTKVVYLRAGDEVILSRNATLTVLQADESGRNKPDDLSMIALIKYGEGTALFTADLPKDREKLPPPDVDILKVAHHGSAGSTSELFAISAAPSVAVIPVGYNSYGHPREEVLKILLEAGANIYRTDEWGAVTASVQMDGTVQIETYVEAQGA